MVFFFCAYLQEMEFMNRITTIITLSITKLSKRVISLNLLVALTFQATLRVNYRQRFIYFVSLSILLIFR